MVSEDAGDELRAPVVWMAWIVRCVRDEKGEWGGSEGGVSLGKAAVLGNGSKLH